MKRLDVIITKAAGLLAAVLTAFAASSCVHEFPVAVDAPVVLSLKYDSELPIYKIVEWETKASANPDDHDVRYVINAYPQTRKGSYSSTPAKTWVLTEEDVTKLDHEVTLYIAEGTYRFMVWTDFVPGGSSENHFFNADSFGEVKENTNYCGNNDMRDCYRGWTDLDVVRFGSEIPPVSGTVGMSRSIAKFTFEAIDLADFLMREAKTQTDKAGKKVNPEDIDLSNYKVVFYYTGFKPSSYNLFSDRPNDSSTGIRFSSKIVQTDSDTAYLGFDYCFSNEDETIVNMAVGVYDQRGNELSLINGIDVPLQRGKHTIIRGRFLTEESYGGVAINPEFDGEFNITI